MVATSSHAFAPVTDARRTLPFAKNNYLQGNRQCLLLANAAASDEEVSVADPSSTTTTDAPPTDTSLPPATVAAAQTVQAEKKKPVAAPKNNHKEGVFSPPVKVAYGMFGEAAIKKLRAKIISAHTELIGDFIDTSQSGFGDAVLTALFNLADEDGNGTIEVEELTRALRALGFDWLDEKKIAGLVKKIDKDKNGVIDLAEWKEGAPKTLKQNLTKLAKKNGGDMGLMV